MSSSKRLNKKNLPKVSTVSTNWEIPILNYSSGEPFAITIDNLISTIESSILDGDYLPLGGGTMTGDILISDGIRIGSTDGNMHITFNITDQLLVFGDTEMGLTADISSDALYMVTAGGARVEVNTGDLQISDSNSFGIYTTSGSDYFDIMNEAAVKYLHIEYTPGAGYVTLTAGPIIGMFIDETANEVEISSTYFYPSGIGTYADDAAAATGGVGIGRMYKTAAGVVHIRMS